MAPQKREKRRPKKEARREEREKRPREALDGQRCFAPCFRSGKGSEEANSGKAAKGPAARIATCCIGDFRFEIKDKLMPPVSRKARKCRILCTMT